MAGVGTLSDGIKKQLGIKVSRTCHKKSFKLCEVMPALGGEAGEILQEGKNAISLTKPNNWICLETSPFQFYLFITAPADAGAVIHNPD